MGFIDSIGSAIKSTVKPIDRMRGVAKTQAGKKSGKASAKTAEKVAKPGDMDILKKLHQEHEEVKDLLGKLVDSKGAVERKAILKKIKLALVPHARAEEKVVYDPIIALKKEKAKVDGNEGYVEHSLVDRILGQLGKIRDAKSPEFTAHSKVLKELLEHHIKEEESSIWSEVRANFSDDQRLAMNRKFEAEKKKVRVPA